MHTNVYTQTELHMLINLTSYYAMYWSKPCSTSGGRTTDVEYIGVTNSIDIALSYLSMLESSYGVVMTNLHNWN